MRTAVEVHFPNMNVGLITRDGKSRGMLSKTGYVSDVCRILMGVDANFGKSAASHWEGRSVADAVYGLTFRHQQRGKHEARDYSLQKLESLANSILGAYVLFAQWAIENGEVENRVREKRDFARNVAVLYWPETLRHQLSGGTFGGEDRDLQAEVEKLRGWAGELVGRALELRERGVDSDSDEMSDFFRSVEALAEDYEMLVSNSHMRELGREQEAGEHM